MKKLIIIAIMLTFVPGCAQKIDGSSPESIKASLEAIESSMNDEKKKEFKEAYTAIIFSEMGNIFGAAGDSEGAKKRIKDKLDGKTANDIIAEGNRIIAKHKKEQEDRALERKKEERERNLERIEEVKAQIAELEQKQSEADIAKNDLKKFKILDSSFYIQKSRYRDEAVIELTVKNQTPYAVSRAYFQGVLSSPGRSIPWVEDTFNYSIRGGLEPGEQVTWNLSPNMFGSWANAPKDRKDMVLTVTVTRIDGADGEPIYDSEINEWDKEKLGRLKTQLIELEKTLLN